MEVGGVAWVSAEQQRHSDAIRACPGKEMYHYYRSLIILSKRRCSLEEAFLAGLVQREVTGDSTGCERLEGEKEPRQK